jgi:hypothetical protein
MVHGSARSRGDAGPTRHKANSRPHLTTFPKRAGDTTARHPRAEDLLPRYQRPPPSTEGGRGSAPPSSPRRRRWKVRSPIPLLHHQRPPPSPSIVAAPPPHHVSQTRRSEDPPSTPRPPSSPSAPRRQGSEAAINALLPTPSMARADPVSFRQHRAISGISFRHQQKVLRILGKQERGRGGQGHNREAKLIQSSPFCRPHLDGFTVPPPHRDHGEGAGWLALGPPQPAARRDKVSHPQPSLLPYSRPISPPSGCRALSIQNRMLSFVG